MFIRLLVPVPIVRPRSSTFFVVDGWVSSMIVCSIVWFDEQKDMGYWASAFSETFTS